MKPQVIQVQGTSMRPFIRHGDYVVIEPCSLREVYSGDVIGLSLSDENRLRMHRLVWKNHRNSSTVLFIKGDSISSLEKIQAGQDGRFLGKAISVIRNEKTISISNNWLNLVRLGFSLCLMPWQLIRGH